MIIDALVRFWSGPEQLGPELSRRIRATSGGTSTPAPGVGPIDASADAIQRAIAPLGGAFVMGLQAQAIHASVPNDILADAIRRAGGRLLGASGIDPAAPGAIAEYDHARSLGLLAVCVSPSTQQFHPTHSAATRLFTRCAEDGTVVFASRPGPLIASASVEFDRPAAWDDVLRSAPGLKLVIGEMGWPWVDEAIALAAKHPTVFLTTDGLTKNPWQLYGSLLTATARGAIDRILFASGFPFESPAKAVEALYGLGALAQATQLPAIPRATIRSIVERDAFQALGIPTLAPPPQTPVGSFGFGAPFSAPPAQAGTRHG